MLTSPASGREEIHHRNISIRAYKRDDGLFDIEAHLVDTKPFHFHRMGGGEPVKPGTPLHDLWLRLTVDDSLVVQDVAAAADAAPFSICSQAGAGLIALKGARIGAGWSRLIRENFEREDSCTHLIELLKPMATVALQATRALKPEHRQAVDANGRPQHIDSCFSFSARRGVVARLWPQHHAPE